MSDKKRDGMGNEQRGPGCGERTSLSVKAIERNDTIRCEKISCQQPAFIPHPSSLVQRLLVVNNIPEVNEKAQRFFPAAVVVHTRAYRSER